MNLCGERKIASLYASGSRPGGGSMWMSTYGAHAAKSQNDSAPCRCRRAAIPQVSDTMPVTLLAAENEPILSGRSAYVSSSAASWAWSMCPSASSRMVTTSAIDSRHGQLVGVVLERSDEDDRPLLGRDHVGQVVAVVEARPGCAGRGCR